MASVVQAKLKKIKSSARNAVDKYKEALEQTLSELKKPSEIKDGMEAFLVAGMYVYISE